MQQPFNRKELQRIPQYSALVFPLTKLVKISTEWRWGTDEIQVFGNVRELLQR
ncbi:hypothetical protein PR003_g940 [Phytophthora rubi]|nr:hypothetical protein PR002_g5738 [Phytophthora rubi]KAE9359071.1 hypothetical protein PR003_g940 [Phytophthora rubi]